jgi:gamma-glutamyltranspeptidase/glutathione hydrolase/leukotriene-C4 hydrolase
MLDATYMAALQANTSDTHTQDVRIYGGRWSLSHTQTDVLPEDHGTTHISIVDAAGNAVALTSTINTEFGSKVLSASTGILLNDEMDDFSTPNSSNSYGLAPFEANYIAPYKRPLSSMAPTIVLHQDNVRLVAGASGGPRIITATTQVLCALLRPSDL